VLPATIPIGVISAGVPGPGTARKRIATGREAVLSLLAGDQGA